MYIILSQYVHALITLGGDEIAKYAPIRWRALYREWSFGPAHYWHIRALKHKVITWNSAILENSSVIVHRTMIEGHWWQKNSQ